MNVSKNLGNFDAILKNVVENKIVIIGAGPAGVITSLYLSKSKISHVLLDKAVFPRNKVCGESFAGNIFKVLDDIDPLIKKEMYEKGIVKHANHLSLYANSSSRFVFKMPSSKPAKIQASRFEFDEYLVRKASNSKYCTLMEGFSVKNAVKESKNIKLLLSDKSTINANMVVFSNGGVGSLVKNLRDEIYNVKGSQFLFARGVYRNVNVVNAKSAIDFTLLKTPFNNGCYLTYLPNGNVTVGLMVEAKLLKENINYSLEETFIKSVKNHPYLNDVIGDSELISEIKTTSLKLGKFKKKFAGDNYLIAGDAAVPLNPVTGMGVMMAMYYGRNAANVIIDAVKKNDFSYNVLRSYDAHCNKKFKSEFRKSNIYTYLQINHLNFFIRIIKLMDSNKLLEKWINRVCFKS